MPAKLSPAAQSRVSLYEGFSPHVAKLNSLVEQFAIAKGTQRDQLRGALKRAAGQTKLQFAGANLEQLSQVCGSIELAAGRASNPLQLVRLLRELVGSLKFQLDFEIRTIIREDQEAAAKKLRAEEQAAE